MFRIAICDDRLDDLKRVCTEVKKWLSIHPAAEGRIDLFHSAEELRKVVQEKPWEYDLYILDIVMQGENRIEFGSWIKRYSGEALMIYVTSSRDYAMEAFDNHAIRYLMKPVDERELQKAMDVSYSLFCARPRNFLVIQNQDKVSRIVMEEIMYIENNLKNVTYTLRDGRTLSQLRRQGSFEEVVGIVAKTKEFLQPHKSFFVNIRYISSLQGSIILMDDGKTIPIARRRVEETKRKYIQFISEVSAYE